MVEYIEREAAIESFRKNLDGGYVLTNDAQTTHILQSIPAADVRPVLRGKWRELWKREDSTDYECTACGSLLLDVQNDDDHPLVSYCPNCGADMREGR